MLHAARIIDQGDREVVPVAADEAEERKDVIGWHPRVEHPPLVDADLMEPQETGFEDRVAIQEMVRSEGGKPGSHEASRSDLESRTSVTKKSL